MTPSRIRLWIVVVIGLAALSAHVAHYFPFLVDDSLISLRYAQRLLHGQGLTWSDGDRVEGYSSLLWVLLCAGLGRFCDLIVAARVLGILAVVATLAALFYSQRKAWPLAVGVAAFAASGPIAAWAGAGMEAPLALCLFAWGLALALPGDRQPRHFAAGAFLAALCLTRPDAPPLVAALFVGVWLTQGWRPAVRLASLPVFAVAGQLAFRLAYYHEWVPNTALVKVAFTRYRIQMGAAYVGRGALSFLGLLLLVIFFCRRRKRVLLLWCPLVVWVPYVVVVGGDFMPAHRFLLPCLAVLIFLAMEAADAAVALPARAAISALIGFYALTQFSDPFNLDAVGFDRDLIQSGEAIGRLLDRAFKSQQPLVAVDAAGAVPYFSGLPALDMLGLNDRWIAHHPPADRGHSLPGHDLGDGSYVLRRAPDLILFQEFRTAAELLGRRDFQQQYARVILDVPANLWARKDGRVGIARSDRRIVIPGFLFAGCVARWDAQTGRLVAVMAPRTTATVHDVAVPAGRWKATSSAVSVVSTSPNTIDVSITSTDQARVDQVVLQSAD